VNINQNNIDDATAKDRKGSALVIVMCLAGILMIAGAAMTQMAGTSAVKSRKLQYSARALAVAESGVAEMLSRMSTNYYYWSGSSFSMNYDSGSCSVSAVTYTNNGHVLITSTATIGSERKTTVLELLGNLWDSWDHVVGQYGAIVAGGNITLSTGALQCYGGIHANGNVFLGSGSPDVYGDCTASGPTNTMSPAGTQYLSGANAPTVPIPNYWDEIDHWIALATNGGLYYPSGLNASGNILPGNGVVYVVGNASLRSCNLTGVLIATGNIDIDNRCEQSPFPGTTNWPCLISGGNITEDNRNSYWGVVWARGDVTIQNRRLINGSIISYNGNVEIRNNTDIYPLPSNPAWVPTDTNDRPPAIMMGGWLQ
jgi:Tfp pilus assembly protein PilX